MYVSIIGSYDVLSPLADPVIGAIFANAEVAGMAAKSLIRVTLESEGDNTFEGKILRVTPQRSYIGLPHRGCRVDIEVESDANEIAIFEIQIDPDIHIMKRDLFSASHIFTRTSSKGDTSAQMAAKLPRVICINILGYNLREDNKEVVQPFMIQYTKPPVQVAIPNFSGYNIQLPRILEMEPDFTNGLYCWGYTLYTAHVEGKTIKEVLDMQPALQTYAREDEGYQQFCEQYQLVATDPRSRDEYAMWFNARMREEGMKEAAIEIGLQQGMQQGIQQGIQQQSIFIARNLISANLSIDKIAEVTGLSTEEVLSIKNDAL